MYIISWLVVDINTFVPMVCRQRTGGALLESIFSILILAVIALQIAGWIIVFICYMQSGIRQQKRLLRHRLRHDKSLPPMECEYIKLLVSGAWSQSVIQM